MQTSSKIMRTRKCRFTPNEKAAAIERFVMATAADEKNDDALLLLLLLLFVCQAYVLASIVDKKTILVLRPLYYI